MNTDWIYDLGVELNYTNNLPSSWLGAYDDDQRRIFVRHGLTRRLEKQTLAHEFMHAYYRDRSSHPTVEWRAWRGTASLLVDPAEYAAAERMSHSSTFIAAELDITTRVVEAYRDALARGELLADLAA